MDGFVKFTPDPKLKLMDQVVQVLRYHHYAYRTEKIYCEWIVRFLKFYNSYVNPYLPIVNKSETYPVTT